MNFTQQQAVLLVVKALWKPNKRGYLSELLDRSDLQVQHIDGVEASLLYARWIKIGMGNEAATLLEQIYECGRDRTGKDLADLSEEIMGKRMRVHNLSRLAGEAVYSDRPVSHAGKRRAIAWMLQRAFKRSEPRSQPSQNPVNQHPSLPQAGQS